MKVKEKKPINKESDRRKRERPIYLKKRDAHLRKNPKCQIRIMGICKDIATQVHHSAKRGENYLNEETFLSSCDQCHDYVERIMSAEERREKGFLK